MRRAFVAVATAALTVSAAKGADAGGMYFSDRGVRPMGRAGAFVAGADDGGAIWYNPAGLADAGDSFLADFAYLRMSNTYTRRLRITDADGTVRNIDSPEIRGSTPLLPLPTFAFTKTLDADKKWTGALGFIAPYVALTSYPETTDDGKPSPARYTLGSFNGSLLGIPGMWLAWKPSEKFRIGIGTFALIGTFQSTITFSVCPQDRLLCAPEQPEWDAAAQMKVGPMFAPTGNGGVIWIPDPHVRFGLSGQLPIVISSNATLKVRLPSSVALDSASVRGDQAHVRIVLPAVLRAGIELRPLAKATNVNAESDLRIEVAWVREFWSAHNSIEATPDGIYLENITGAPKSVAMPKISIPRGFVDSDSFRLGSEWSFLVSGYRLALRSGISYETTAVPRAYMSLSSLDFPKTTLMIGSSLWIGKRWRFDAVLGHMFTQDVVTSPGEAKIDRISPLKGNAGSEPVNGGTYTATAQLIGFGLEYKY